MLLLIPLFLVSLCYNLVSAQYVLDAAPHTVGYQMDFPYQRKAKVVKTVDIEIKTEKDSKFTLKCTNYEEENSKVDILDKDGLYVDTVTFLSSETDPCDEATLKGYIYIPEPSSTNVKITYLWASKKPRCVQRSYTIEEFPIMAMVMKPDYPRVECPQSIKDYISKVPQGKEPGGIINVSPPGRHNVMDYNSDVEKEGEPKTLEFPTKDLEGKSFKLICREDTLTGEDPETKKNTIVTGSIVHQDSEYKIIEKFKMTSCSTDYINVNRQIFNKRNHYKVIYKKANGQCFERAYQEFDTKELFYYDINAALHFYPQRIKCPKTFVGDIHINASRSWYKRLLGKILPNSNVTPFAIETSDPKKAGFQVL